MMVHNRAKRDFEQTVVFCETMFQNSNNERYAENVLTFSVFIAVNCFELS